MLESRSYFELMSCRLLAHQTADDCDRPLPRLFVRKDLDHAQVMQALSGSQVQDPAQVSPLLTEMSSLAFLFQEMPVQFEIGADGHVAVAPYRKNDQIEGPPAAEHASDRLSRATVTQQGDSPATTLDETRPAKRRPRPK